MSIKSHLIQIAFAGAVAYTAFNLMPTATVYKEKIQAKAKNFVKSEQVITAQTPIVAENKKQPVVKEIKAEKIEPKAKYEHEEAPTLIQQEYGKSVFNLDEIYHCFYDDKTGTWDMKPETGWIMTGHYDLKGETKGKVRDVNIKYYQQYNATLNAVCTVQPEWGNEYIDEDCKKRHINNFKEYLYNVVYKKRFEGKNIYKICANRCGGGIGHCDESMYW